MKMHRFEKKLQNNIKCTGEVKEPKNGFLVNVAVQPKPKMRKTGFFKII